MLGIYTKVTEINQIEHLGTLFLYEYGHCWQCVSKYFGQFQTSTAMLCKVWLPCYLTHLLPWSSYRSSKTLPVTKRSAKPQAINRGHHWEMWTVCDGPVDGQFSATLQQLKCSLHGVLLNAVSLTCLGAGSTAKRLEPGKSDCAATMSFTRHVLFPLIRPDRSEYTDTGSAYNAPN